MSAIFGILRFDGAEVAAADLARMARALAHRGPDGQRSLVDGPLGLGHGLMRVNREDMFEAQPLYDAEGDLTLVADLRIDNREALADSFAIPAEDLRDLPDSALVLRAYRKWGEDCCRHLVGDFAFAVWDGGSRKLFLARDHMGQRNLLYHVGDGWIAFASEIKALWALPDVPRRLLEDEIGRHLLAMPQTRPDGGTMYEGILGLTGGMTLTAEADGAMKTRRYWRPGSDPAHEGRDEAYYIETYRGILGEAVACRLRRLTRPAALLMSAGFDTAAIAGLAGPALAAQGRKLIAYSAVVSDGYVGTKYDIRPWVEACRRVMPHLDVRYLLARNGPPFAGIERAFAASDGPAALVSELNDEVYGAAAAAGARLAMDGLGGDYTVNPGGAGALARLLRQGRIGAFASELSPHMRLTGQSIWGTLRHDVAGQLAPAWLRRWLWRLRGHAFIDRAGFPIADSLRQRLAREGVVTDTLTPFNRIPPTAMRAQSVCVATLVSQSAIPGPSVRAASHGLDYTSPFHDRRVVEFGLSIPEDLYVKNGRNRYLACMALADVYPPEFQTRRRGNDLQTPDFLAGLAPHLPDLLVEAERLERSAGLAAYVDFRKLRALLGGPRDHDQARARARVALHALRIARYVEWFRRGND